jgi:hypothetical protein
MGKGHTLRGRGRRRGLGGVHTLGGKEKEEGGVSRRRRRGGFR